MQRIRLLRRLLFLACLPALLNAEGNAERVRRLESAVLAPCCYTGTVGAHQSEIAVKMRVEIARWVEEGRTDQAILGEYVERYGDKVLVDPRTRPTGWSFVTPWAAVVLGSILTGWLVWRWRPVGQVAMASGEPMNLPEIPDLDD